MRKLKNMKQSTLLCLLAIALLAATVLMGYIHQRAGAMGTAIGKSNGTAVGTAIGSARGITEGAQQGRTAGEQAGLSAEDTTEDIKGCMEGMGRLEVLIADVTLKNINKIGKSNASLSLISGNAVFTIDMAQVDINREGNSISITVPKPELDLSLNQGNTRKLAEYQKFSLTVSAEDGLVDYLNSMTQTVEKVKETMSNYDSLYAEAMESAKSQIQQLANRICGTNTAVQVRFK